MNKRIVVLESNQLINAGVRSLLSHIDTFEVIGLDSTLSNLLAEVIELQPEVIIVEESSLRARTTWYLQLLQLPQPIRVIILNVAHNQVQVWDRGMILVDRLGDFLELI